MIITTCRTLEHLPRGDPVSICQDLLRIKIQTVFFMAVKPKLLGGAWVRDMWNAVLCLQLLIKSKSS